MGLAIILAALGLSGFIFHMGRVIIQIVSNNLFNIYGASTIYGSNISIAAEEQYSRSIIFNTIVIVLVQGGQPIMRYNYGAKKYLRVKTTCKLILKITIVISIIFWLIFHIFPAQIMSTFASNDKLYLDFAVQYVHIFLFFVFINGAQITASTFFQAIGMAKKEQFWH